jgi:hypothetical protein
MTDKATLEAVRFAVGGITAGPEEDWCDNLTVALCTYFERHPGKPDTHEETEHGWHPWAEEQTDSLIEAIAQAAIDAMPGWQAIETAPKTDGDYILVYSPEGTQVAWWCEQGHWLTSEGKFLWDEPTHWMPLSEPPEDE